jgi:CRISPR-associated protein Csy1
MKRIKMTDSPPDPIEVAALRGLVDGFIQERLQLKLDKLKGDDDEVQAQRLALHQAHVRETWLADAAKRVPQIQLASHTLKPIHPDARGTNLYVDQPVCTDTNVVGTHTLQGQRTDDVVGNAAALDVFKFLKLQHKGQSMLTRLSRKDGAALHALSSDTQGATQWAQAFAGIVDGKGGAASHTLAKQLYFPLPDDGYHLLAPLFPTALVHGVHSHLQEARFSDAAKAARASRRAKEPHAHGYCDYPGMAVRNMGGSKPQNISQLNSERGGANYLLASVPPVWKDQGTQPPLRVTSVFDMRGGIGRDRTVYLIAKALRPFLESVADVDNNMHIRAKRAELVQAIIDRVLDIATELQCLNGGWSADPACKLSWSQKQWLDANALEAAQAAYEAQLTAKGAAIGALAAPEATEWRDKVAEDFARWLNATLSTDKIRMGDAEFVEWKHTFLEVLP